MSQEGQPLHYTPEPGPPVEQVRLGNQTLELDPEAARVVREAFEGLAGQYGQALEQYRAQTLSQLGNQVQRPMPPMPEMPAGLDVPDPDLLFSNKAAWTDEFARNLEQRLGGLEGRQTQLVQGAVQAFQQELQRRDMAQAAQAKHDAVMEEMLNRRGLDEHTLIVQAVYDREYDNLRNLPLELAIDRVGSLAEEEIGRIRSGEKWSLAPVQGGGTTQRPPAMLRSARRAAAPAAAPQQDIPPGGLEAGGGIGMMGKLIRKRQNQVLGAA